MGKVGIFGDCETEGEGGGRLDGGGRYWRCGLSKEKSGIGKGKEICEKKGDAIEMGVKRKNRSENG